MSRYGLFLHILCIVLALYGFSSDNLQAQERPDSLYQQLLKLESAVETLTKQVQEQQQEDELQSLLREADRLSQQEEEQKIDVSRKYFSGVRQQQGLNPNISFGMDFFGGFSTSDVPSISETSDIAYGNNGFFLREAQLSLIAPLDPFSRGKGFISATPEGVFIDEVYMEWLNLPLGMNLKAGYFKSEFGFLNRYHDHALPQFDRPRVMVNLFGTGGLGGTGVASNFLLPSFMAHATSLDLSVIYGNNPQGFKPDSLAGVIFTGQLLNYYDLSASSYLEIRLSASGGRNSDAPDHFNSYVASAGVAYKWAPVGREKYRTLEWKSEFLYGYRQFSGGAHRTKGFYSSIQNKLGARFWIGGRIGYAQLPFDPDQSEWDYTLCLDFWQSEFVMTRIQYQYNHRNITWRNDLDGPFPSEHSFVIQVNWAMGPHKHEAY